MSSFDPLGASLSYSYRFDLLDASHGVIGEVHPVRTPTITQRAAGAVKRSLTSFALPPSEVAEVNPMRDRVRPMLVVAGNAQPYPLGVFVWTDASRRTRTSGVQLESTLSDYGVRLAQPIAESISFQVGDRHTAALLSVIDAAGFMTANAHVDSTPGTFTAPQAWIGSSSVTYYSVLSTIAIDHAGMFDPYFDGWGRLRLRVAPNLAMTIPELRYDDDTRVVRDSVVHSSNLLSAPNRYIVRDSAASVSPITLTYTVPPEAPHSYENRGWYVNRYIDVQGIVSVGQAYDIAAAAYRQDVDFFEEASWSSIVDPRHQSFDVVSLLGLDYLEMEWSITGAVMTHKGKRVAHSELKVPAIAS